MPRARRLSFREEFGSPFRAEMDPESPFAGKNDRRLFINRVYMIVAAMLVPPLGLSFLPFVNDGVAEFYDKNYLAFIIPGFLVYFICLIIVQCCEGPRRSFPCNLILLVLISLSVTLITSSMVSFFNVIVPATCIAMLFAIVFLVGLAARFAPCDLTGCAMLLLLLSVFLLVYGIATTILMIFYHIRLLKTIYYGLGILLTILYIWYDLQLIMGGRRYELEPDEVIFGAVLLFSDIILLFIYLVSFFGDMFD